MTKKKTTTGYLTATQALAVKLNADRLKRKLTWPDYAAHLGMKQTTIYKICTGKTTRAHALTIDEIEQKLMAADVKPATNEPQPEGVASEVVSSR